jgi:hypothetical protein
MLTLPAYALCRAQGSELDAKIRTALCSWSLVFTTALASAAAGSLKKSMSPSMLLYTCKQG